MADELKLGRSVMAEMFDSVSVYFSDIVGFTRLASMCSPMEVVEILNELYSMFDGTIDKHQVYKVSRSFKFQYLNSCWSICCFKNIAV